MAEPLQFDEITALTSADAAASAQAAGMAVVDDDELRLAHPLYGEVILAQLPRLRARVLRLRLADALARRTPRDGP